MSHRWKYLGEHTTKYTTSLREYLTAIFPNNIFIYDLPIHKDIFNERNHMGELIKYHRYRPDARCEDLNLIVEFDGLQHYTSYNICEGDKTKDKWLHDLGYQVVRIPYWLQLSTNVIYNKFGQRMVDPMCELEYSFYDSPIESSKRFPGILASPGAMCEAGRRRFIEEYNMLPEEFRYIVGKDLLMCCQAAEDGQLSSELLCPMYVQLQLNIPLESFRFARLHDKPEPKKLIRL